jgi:hypothetical protein
MRSLEYRVINNEKKRRVEPEITRIREGPFLTRYLNLCRFKWINGVAATKGGAWAVIDTGAVVL